jgi:hypothetical protein
MTDVEYYKLSLLFELKEMTISQAAGLDMWVENYDNNIGAWATPSDMITLLQSWPDKQSG